MSTKLTETPEQGCVNQECAETIKTHPESWKAWKREAERLQSFISHASMIEIACENPSVNDHMVHWEGRAIKAETALTAPSAGEPVAWTYGHCPQKSKPGGCQLHNLHCAYPECDRRAAPPMTAASVTDEREE